MTTKCQNIPISYENLVLLKNPALLLNLFTPIFQKVML